MSNWYVIRTATRQEQKVSWRLRAERHDEHGKKLTQTPHECEERA